MGKSWRRLEYGDSVTENKQIKVKNELGKGDGERTKLEN